MVKAVESVAKLHKWRIYCKKENAYVTMFEKACSFFALGPKEKPQSAIVLESGSGNAFG